MPVDQSAEPSADPRDWRPLAAKPAPRPPEIRDPIIEPLWQGTRVLAHFTATPGGLRPGAVEFLDVEGIDVTRDFRLAAEALADVVYANAAVIDGVLTDQATAGGEGVAIVTRADVSALGMVLGRPPEIKVEAIPGRASTPVAFVAIDVLSIDGQPMFDVPLLERKRQLETLVDSNELARVSPFARPPIAQWLNSWKSAGFRGVILKAANSRYREADVAKGWAIIERAGGR